MKSHSDKHPVSDTRLNVIVVGAGLSGLTTAIASSMSGHNVTIFESAKELQEASKLTLVGAGLQMTPNATRILQRLELPSRLWDSAVEPTYLQVHRYSGEVLMTDDGFHEGMRAKYRAPFLDVHRVDLQQALYDRARAMGVQFRLGEKVESIDFGVPRITTASGAEAKADLVVAADGLRSRCRDCFLQASGVPADKPQPTGDLAYRIVLHVDQIADPELVAWVRNVSVHFWAGPGAHAVGYSLCAGTVYNLVLLVPDDLPPGVDREAGSVEEMMARFKDWDPILTRFLAMVTTVDRWKLMHRSELPSWVNDESNLVFVGDSCHPMLPYLAQGANSAIEDGAVLGLLLGHVRSKSDLPAALKVYESLRKTRGEAIVKEAFRQRESFHMPDGPEQEARDRILKGPIQAPYPSRWSCPKVQSWLYGYDAFQEVEEARRANPFSSTE